MLFTAPAFMFVFLPLSIIFCAVFGKGRRRLCLTLVCVMYYILANVSTPINLVWLPILTVYAYCSGRLMSSVKTKKIGILLGAVPLVWLILMRQLVYYGGAYAYPVGMTLPSMCVAAYIWDVTYGEEAEVRFFDLWLYLNYFPIMLVGPFVGYADFRKCCEDGGMAQGLEGCSSGIRLFAVGVIKRIAVGAVLIEGYDKIFAYSWESPNLAIILFLLVLIYFGVFFSLSGYYDMAVGISRMYGIRMDAVRANPFKVATVNEYSKTLFGSARLWTRRYIISPIEEIKDGAFPAWLKAALYAVCTVLFIRTDLASMTLLIPLVAFSFASGLLRLDKSYKMGRTGLRAVFGVLTLLVIGVFWAFITIGASGELLFEYLDDITSGNAEYQTDMVLISFSALKYLCVILVGLVTLVPCTDWIMKIYEGLNDKRRALADYGSLAVLLVLFLFTVIFFLPAYPMYNDVPFEYIMI